MLAEGWREEGEELDELELSTRAEPFSLVANGETGTTGIPELVMVITAGVDVQRKDRLEVNRYFRTPIMIRMSRTARS